MSDCEGCKDGKLKDILTDVIRLKANIEKEQTTPRVGMLMRMIGNEVKTAAGARKDALRKELIQASAACLRYLEQLT